MTPKFYGQVTGTKLVLDQEESFKNYYPKLQGRVELIVRRVRKDRSSNENRYYFGVVVKMLGDELGYTPEEMHEALKFHFLRDESRKLPTVKSTADLSTVEFESYLTQIRQWASVEMGIYIPLPNEVEF